jgi:hypothetical protein
MIGDYEVWRMIRAAESEAMAQNHALRARLQFATRTRPSLLQRFVARRLARPAAPLAPHPDARHDEPAVHPVVRRTLG